MYFIRVLIQRVDEYSDQIYVTAPLLSTKEFCYQGEQEFLHQKADTRLIIQALQAKSDVVVVSKETEVISLFI